MCGIFAVLNMIQSQKNIDITKQFMMGQFRGPDSHTLKHLKNINSYIGFHRLPINGFRDPNAEQPFNIDNIKLICNGEIYNFKQLYKVLGVEPNSSSDCEVIIHMYKKYGIEQTLQMLDGVFAFILLDFNSNQIFVARDTYGIRPLFFNISETYTNDGDTLTTYALASELKSIDVFDGDSCEIKQFEPGCCSVFNIDESNERQKINYIKTFVFARPDGFCNLTDDTPYEKVLENVFYHLEQAVIKRVDNTERDIACLLSGGLDSSIICALVKKHHKGTLHTWSIGFEGSEDLKYAKMVADHIGSVHHSIQVSEQEFLDYIPEVVKAIESYDTTTVRASVGNWLISKYIRENSDAKVIFNGDGSDEVMGGYLYFHAAPDSIAFDKECRKLLANIHFFDVLRSDRSISSHGLEARTPFLDRKFVQYYLSINPNLRHHASQNKPEKYIIREAIDMYSPGLLPSDVLWRTKEAFSDGVSGEKKAWFEVIQDHIKEKVYSHMIDDEGKIIKDMNPYYYNKPETLEQLYYRDLFYENFKNNCSKKCLPYFWMPNFVEATDASARTLQVYKEINESN